MPEGILSDNGRIRYDRRMSTISGFSSSGEGYLGLLRLAGEIGREPALQGLLEMILQKSRPWMQAEACSIFLPDPGTGELVIHSAHGDSAPQLGSLRVPQGAGIVGAAMKEKKMIRVDDVSRDPRFFGKADEQTGWKTRALLAAPLLDGSDCVGVIEFLNPQGRPAFTRQDEELMEYFAGLVSSALVRIRAHDAALERAQVQRDLDLAREMQQGLLPKQFPTREQAPGVEIFARLNPAKEVSGDLYDFFAVEPGKICFVVGDVSGKGVAAGLFMAVTRTLIRATAVPGKKPVEILRQVNAQLCPENPANLFVTMILGILDTSNGQMEYGQGGHNPPLLLPVKGEPVYEPSGGMPLGVFDDAKFGERRLTLKPGESLLIYTDGVTEAMNPKRELFGEERFQRAVQGLASLSPEQLTQRVVEEVAKFANGAEPSDDITLLAIKHRAG
jgi:serine phosphatase RsbU (regulator of sigma subunit)/putative methionine-R-sulfoxide reductase with GAF domain